MSALASSHQPRIRPPHDDRLDTRFDNSSEIGNNSAERFIRPIVLGRKNWLFGGSDKGGERAAGILSLIETTRLNGLDPESFLRDVLIRIAAHPVNRTGEFLPWNGAAKGCL